MEVKNRVATGNGKQHVACLIQEVPVPSLEIHTETPVIYRMKIRDE